MSANEYPFYFIFHSECAPCSAIYYAARYAMAHYDKYSEPYKPLIMY